MTTLYHFLVRVPDRPNFTIFPYIHYEPMAFRKDFCPILIIYFEELSKTHSIIVYECLVREESMTKNGNFSQNLQNRPTPNGCRIALTNK
jgi:hypothetical protein